MNAAITTSKRLFILLGLIVSLLLATASWFYYQSQRKAIIREKSHDLEGIARLKASQLVQWQAERLSDARVMVGNPFFMQAIQKLRSTGMTDDLMEGFLELFMLVNTNYGYNNIILSDIAGNYLLGTRPGESKLDAVTGNLIQKAIENKSHLFTYIYYCPYHDELHYDLIVPVWNDHTTPLAVVILRNDPNDHLFTFLNEWPTPSPTAESVLARAEGNEVIFINSPRLSSQKPLSVRLTINDTLVPVVKAAAGYTGFTHGIDYRGKKVISFVMPVEGTPWFLAVKMDNREIFKELTESTISIIVFTLLLILLLGAALVAIYSFRQRGYYKHILLKEKALEESEHNYREVFNSTSEAIFVDEAETGKIIDVNDAMLRMYGYNSKAEVLKGSIGDLSANIAPYTEDVAQQNIMKARTIGPQTFEWLAKMKSGEVFWAEVTLRKATIGGADRILAVVRDITDRKNLELDLRHSEEMLRKVLDTIPVRVFWKSRDLIYLGCNMPFVKDAGMKSIDEVIGKTDYDMGWHEVAEIYRADDKAVIESGEPKLGYEEPQTNTEGREMWLKTSKIPLRDGDGNILGVLGVYEDITTRKRNELELNEKQQALEVQNEEYYALNEEYLSLNEELKATNENLLEAVEKAQESERLKTAFLNNLSHEIRTPLNAIIGFSDFLGNPELNSDEQKKFVNVIQRNGFQLAGIINDIVSIATIEAGQEKLRESETNVVEVLETVVQQFEKQAGAKNIRLSFNCSLDHEAAMVVADETKLTQMLGNLVNNALKFTEKGSVTIDCSSKSDMLHFKVTDTGIGIDPKHHEGIFERFRQVEPDPSKFYGGNGLGLAITKAYAGLMGGKIWLESTPGNGSTFHFTIAYQPTSKQHAMEKTAVPEKSGKKTILIVEDEHSNYFFLEIMFNKMNIAPIIALNGQEAIDICRENHDIDLVLMDLKMPVLNGFEATRVIKEMRPGLPIIAQTAYALSSDKHRAFEAGCDDYLTKPIRKQDLMAVLAKYL